MQNHSGPGGAEVVIDIAGTHVGHMPSSPPRTGPNRCRHTDSCMGSSAAGRTNDGLPITDCAPAHLGPGRRARRRSSCCPRGHQYLELHQRALIGANTGDRDSGGAGRARYSQLGFRPQEALNKQFVEQADMALAIFANGLGTPTGEADPDTVEEIVVMRKAGKPVSLVRNTNIPMTGGTEAAEQRLKLEGTSARCSRSARGRLLSTSNSRGAGYMVSSSSGAGRRRTRASTGHLGPSQSVGFAGSSRV